MLHLIQCLYLQHCVSGIVQYMLEQAKPASRDIKSKKDLDIFLKQQFDPVFITCVADQASHIYSQHDNLANAGRESPLTFAHTFSSEVVSSLGLVPETSAILTPQRYIVLIDGHTRHKMYWT